MPVSRRWRNITNKSRLLRFCQGFSFRLLPVMGPFDFVHYAIGRIQPNDAVSNCCRKNRMKNCVYDFHTVWFESLVVNQGQIKLLDITVFDIRQLHLSDFFPYILIIHVFIVFSGRLLDLNLLRNISIIMVIQRCPVCFVCFDSIFQISSDSLFHWKYLCL